MRPVEDASLWEFLAASKNYRPRVDGTYRGP